VKKALCAEDEEELGLIRDEAGKYLPFDDMSAVDYDFLILGKPYNSNGSPDRSGKKISSAPIRRPFRRPISRLIWMSILCLEHV